MSAALQPPPSAVPAATSPCRGGIISNYGGNYSDICVVPEIALEDNETGQHLLLVFASLCEIILALGFHLHERGVVRDRWGGAPHPASTNERARKSAQPSPARGEGSTRIACGRGILVRFRRCRPTPNPSPMLRMVPLPVPGRNYFAFANIGAR